MFIRNSIALDVLHYECLFYSSPLSNIQVQRVPLLVCLRFLQFPSNAYEGMRLKGGSRIGHALPNVAGR